MRRLISATREPRSLASNVAVSVCSVPTIASWAYRPIWWRTMPRIRNAAIANTPAKTSAKRKAPLLKGLCLAGLNSVIDPIASAAHRLDQLLAKAAVHLGAQPAHMAFDHVGLGIEMKGPDILQQHRTGHHLARMLDQIFKKLVFLRLELDPLTGARNGALDPVDGEIAHRHRDGRVGYGRPARERVDPGDQLGRGERLDQIVVSAGLQALHPIIDAIHCGEQ